MMIKKFSHLFSLFCSHFVFYTLLLSHANVYACFSKLKDALQKDKQLAVQLNAGLMKDTLDFIKVNGKLLSLQDIQQLVAKTFETLTSTLPDVDLPVEQCQSRNQCMENIKTLHQSIHEPCLEDTAPFAIKGAFYLTLQQTLKLTSSLQSPQRLKSKVWDFLQNPSKNTHDLASKFLVLKLTREVKFLETITSLIFDSQFKQSDLILLICRLFHTGLAILDSMKNQSDKDVQASYQKISNQLDAIRAAMSHPLTLIDSQLPSSCNPSNQEWIQIVEKLAPTDKEIPGALRRKMTELMPLLRNDYEEGLQHLLKVGLLSSNPLSDNLAADPLGTPLAQKSGPHELPSNHHQSLDPLHLGISSQRRQSKELTSNGGPSQPLSKRARSDSRTDIFSESAEMNLDHGILQCPCSPSPLTPALSGQRPQKTPKDRLQRTNNPRNFTDLHYPTMVPKDHVPKSRFPRGSSSQTTNWPRLAPRPGTLIINPKALQDRALQTNTACAAQVSNANKQARRALAQEAKAITKRIESDRTKPIRIDWILRILNLSQKQSKAKGHRERVNTRKVFFEELEKEIPNSKKMLCYHQKKYITEELFLFLFNSSNFTTLDTLDAETLGKQWKEYLESKQLTASIWEEPSLAIIEQLNETTYSFVSQAQQGISCNIFELAKLQNLVNNESHSDQLQEDIISIILRMQTQIVLHKIQNTASTTSLQTQTLRQTNVFHNTDSNHKPSEGPSAPHQRPLGSLLASAPLEDALRLTQVHKKLLNTPTGVRICS